jgi:hypothetical protein
VRLLARANLVEALNKHYTSYSDRELAEKFSFSLEQVCELRKNLARLKWQGGILGKGRKNLSPEAFIQR